MLVFDPNMRINANEALHHAYFNEYRRQYLFSGLNHFAMNNDASANQAMPFISNQQTIQHHTHQSLINSETSPESHRSTSISKQIVQ